jgi:hypothetical protein
VSWWDQAWRTARYTIVNRELQFRMYERHRRFGLPRSAKATLRPARRRNAPLCRALRSTVTCLGLHRRYHRSTKKSALGPTSCPLRTVRRREGRAGSHEAAFHTQGKQGKECRGCSCAKRAAQQHSVREHSGTRGENHRARGENHRAGEWDFWVQWTWLARLPFSIASQLLPPRLGPPARLGLSLANRRR